MPRRDKRQTIDQAMTDLLGSPAVARDTREAFVRAPVEHRIAALRGTRVERLLNFKRDAINEEKRTVTLSISSDAPYERWWGIEILDHGKGSLRTERLDSGFALLVGHDARDQVGVGESWALTPARKLEVTYRFGRSDRAEEIWQDVLDMIRTNTSVGYIIHDLILEKQEEGVSTYRITDWEPLEGSLVSVPADHTVGVGRQAELVLPFSESTSPERTEMPMPEKTADQIAAETKAATDKAAKEAVERERKRVADIQAAGREYASRGGVEIANELLSEPEATVETFRQRMLAKLAAGNQPTPTAEPGQQGPQFGSGARHVIRRGGLLRAFTKPLRFSDGSEMHPEECAYRAGQWLRATVGQNQHAAKWCNERGIDVAMHRVATTDVDSAGGYLVPTEMEQAVIDLREMYGLARRLARRRPMTTDTRSVPKRTGGVTAYFIEEDNSGVTDSDKGWGNVNFVAKTLAALSIISQNLEEDSIIDVVDDLAREQAWAFAQKEDQCWLVGDGTSTYGGMTGLLTLFNASALASRFNAASNHDTFAEFDAADLSGTMAVVADFAGLNPSWVGSKVFAEMVLNRIKATAGGNTTVTLGQRTPYSYLGYEAFTSEVMPTSQGDVSDITVALFGDFSQSSSYGDRRGIQIQVLRERYAEKLQIGVLASERFHIINHDVGTTAVKGPVAGLYGD